MTISYPLVNGHRYSFASIEVDFEGKKFLGFTEINYKDSLEPGKLRGLGPQVIGRTRGDYDSEGSFKCFRQEFDELTTALGDGYGEKSITIAVTYSEENQPTVTDRLTGVRIKSVDNSNSQGTDATEVSCELDVLLVERNGKTLVKNPRK